MVSNIFNSFFSNFILSSRFFKLKIIIKKPKNRNSKFYWVFFILVFNTFKLILLQNKTFSIIKTSIFLFFYNSTFFDTWFLFFTGF